MAAALATLRRMLRRESASTTVTVTRVVGTPTTETSNPTPETVVFETTEPAKDTAAIKLARAAMVVSSVAVLLAVSTIAWRIVRRELELGTLK